MDPMEVFKIEVTGQEEFGAKKYRELIMDILQDLGLIRSIGKLYVYVDINEAGLSPSTGSFVPAFRHSPSRMWVMC